jgi:hypothetical protein
MVETEKEEVERQNVELLFELDRPKKSVTIYEFFILTQSILGMTQPVGFKVCRKLGILGLATKNRCGLWETLPTADYRGKASLVVDDRSPRGEAIYHRLLGLTWWNRNL